MRHETDGCGACLLRGSIRSSTPRVWIRRMTTPSPADVRAWAQQQGYQVAGSGRIPAAIRQAYDEAHPAVEPEAVRAVSAQAPEVATAPLSVPDSAPPPRGPYAGPVEHRPAPWADHPPAPRQGTDGLAITALVLGFLGVLGMVFGIIALLRIRRSGRPGRGMAIAGIVLSSLWIAGIAAVAIAADGADRGADGTVQAAGSVTSDDIRVGDCPKKIAEGQDLFVDLVPCSEPHEAEALASFELDGTAFPGEDEVFRFAEGGCSKRIVAMLPPNSPDYGIFYFAPSAQTWQEGDREVVCLVTAEVEGEQLIGPVPTT